MFYFAASRFFKESSEEEREHAEKLMKFQVLKSFFSLPYLHIKKLKPFYVLWLGCTYSYDSCLFRIFVVDEWYFTRSRIPPLNMIMWKRVMHCMVSLLISLCKFAFWLFIISTWWDNYLFWPLLMFSFLLDPAMELALSLEKLTNEKLLNLHIVMPL